MHRLMIGIEMDGIQDLEEDAILDFFKQERKLNCDDDYLI